MFDDVECSYEFKRIVFIWQVFGGSELDRLQTALATEVDGLLRNINAFCFAVVCQHLEVRARATPDIENSRARIIHGRANLFDEVLNDPPSSYIPPVPLLNLVEERIVMRLHLFWQISRDGGIHNLVMKRLIEYTLPRLVMKILLVILGIASFAPLVQQRSTPTNEKDLKRQQQQARAIALIEQVGSEAELWDDKRSAVEALANAADLLWDRNPSRASKWLTKAWDLVDQVTESSEQNPLLKDFVRQSDKAQLKSIVLRVAHNHDPKLAEQVRAADRRRTTRAKEGSRRLRRSKCPQRTTIVAGAAGSRNQPAA